jgi:hypothetical protein
VAAPSPARRATPEAAGVSPRGRTAMQRVAERGLGRGASPKLSRRACACTGPHALPTPRAAPETDAERGSIGYGNSQLRATSGPSNHRAEESKMLYGKRMSTETAVGLTWAADSCPKVGKSRTVL